tara:strand:+ start:1857 stop:4361 length:2505 start_codon:yes stop_codon:yes gene_type:complete
MRIYFIIFLSIFIFSCGGGGGSSSPSPIQGSESAPTLVPPTPQPAPVAPTCDNECFQTSKEEYEALYEYSSQIGLGMVNASSSYARKATGEGIIVGVVDSGLDETHPELASKVQENSYLSYSNYTPTTEQKRHGTAVSSIAVGNRSDDGSPMHGVAFDAKVFFLAVQLGTAPENYDPVDLGDSSGEGSSDFSGIDTFYDQVFEVFIDNDVDIVNNSFGYTGTITQYTEEQLRSNFSKTIERISQVGVLDEDKTLFVWAAGNTGQYADQGADYSSPDVFPGMPYYLTELRGHSLAVISVDSETGIIDDYSNRCGVAKDFCIAAPGGNVVVAYATSSIDTGLYKSADSCVSDNSCYAVGGGTSYAAPFVSGGLALLAQHFDNQLGNTEILQRILVTADKTGIYSDASIYGQGLMDLNAASKPIGATLIATTMSLEDKMYSTLSSSMNQIGYIGGDGLENAIKNKNFVVFDELGAPFQKPLSSAYSKNLPSLSWLSSLQSNASQRIREFDTTLNESTSLILGLAINNYGEHDFSKSLWAKDDKKLRYLSVVGQLSKSVKYFMGKGLSPSSYLGLHRRELDNNFGKSFWNSSPFLELTSNGSFVGAEFNASSGNYFNAVVFRGSSKDSEHFLLKQPDKSGLLFEYKRDFLNTQFSLQTGKLLEPRGFLGTYINGAYGSIEESETFFSGFQVLREYNNFYTRGSMFLGTTNSSFGDQGLVSNLGGFKTTSFSFGLFSKKGFGKYDSFGLQIDQPLRLEEGRMNLSVPVGRTKSRIVLFEEHSIDIAPKGRELDIKFIYNWPLASGFLSSSVGYIKDHHHFSDQDGEFYFSTNIEFRISE